MPLVRPAEYQPAFLPDVCQYLFFDLLHLVLAVAVVVNQVPIPLFGRLDAARVSDQVIPRIGNAHEVAEHILAERDQPIEPSAVVYDPIHFVFPNEIVHEQRLELRIVRVEPLVLLHDHNAIATALESCPIRNLLLVGQHDAEAARIIVEKAFGYLVMAEKQNIPAMTPIEILPFTRDGSIPGKPLRAAFRHMKQLEPSDGFQKHVVTHVAQPKRRPGTESKRRAFIVVKGKIVAHRLPPPEMLIAIAW